MEAKEFGKYLKEKRTEKKLTIRQLELRSGVSNAYISQIERGIKDIPSPDILNKLSTSLGVTYEDLMEKAGYITREELFKTVIKESIGNYQINDYDAIVPTDVKNKEEYINTIMKIANDSNPYELVGDDAANNFINHLLSDKEGEDFINKIITKMMEKKGKDPDKTMMLIEELENVMNSDMDEIIDFIRFKKSKTKDK